jgi:hypothetical protein
MESKADVTLQAKIESATYDESSLIEIRVPLNAPYLSDNITDFERFYGELELDGVHYKYVKRKVENGELVLLCIPNKSKTEFQNSREEFFKLVNDLNNSQNKSKNSTAAFKSVTSEYKKENNSWALAALPSISISHTATGNSPIAPGYQNLPEHPPKA